jgi:predicted RNase H-like nuclease
MLTLGADVARGGWIVVALENGKFVASALERRFAVLLARFPEAASIGVDIPIGLPEAGRRRADAEARLVIGARRASVFFTPPRAALLAPSYSAARAVVPSISAQAFALRGAILEVERQRDPRVREVHPEVSFAELAGAPLAFSKRGWNGQNERRKLLRRAGIRIPDQLDAGLAGAHDVLDAAVAAWSAERIARGAQRTLPRDPEPGEGVIHV